MGLSVGRQVWWWLGGLALLIGFLWLMSGVLTPFLAGAALAYFLDPVADRLERRGLSRALATALITIVSAGVFLAALVVLVPAVVEQLRALIERMPAYAEALRAWIETRRPELLVPGGVIEQGFDTFRRNLQDWSVTALRGAWAGGMAVIDFATLLVITPVVAFYMLMDWDRLVARIDGWIPRDHLDTVRRLAREIDAALAGFVRGQLTVCAILGAFYAAALMLIGLDFGLMIGFFAGLVSFIPFVGSILGGALSIGVALFQFWGQPEWIVAVVAVFLVGQAVEGNYLTPRLVGGSVGLHPVTLMFALSAFGSLMGFTGLLIAVPAAAAIAVLFRFALEQYQAGPLYRGARAAEIAAQGAAERPEGKAGAREGAAARRDPAPRTRP